MSRLTRIQVTKLKNLLVSIADVVEGLDEETFEKINYFTDMNQDDIIDEYVGWAQYIDNILNRE